MLLCLLVAVTVHAQVNKSQYKPPVSLDSTRRTQQLHQRDSLEALRPKVAPDTSHHPLTDTSRRLRTDSTKRIQPRDSLHRPQPHNPADSMVIVDNGLRLGIDISRFVVKYFQPYRTDITFTADYRWKPDLYLAAEFGYNNTQHSDTNYTYKGNGMFLSVGVDKNFLKRNNGFERHMFYGGARYGFAHMSYEIPTYTIYGNYWAQPGENGITGSYPKTSVNVHWIELLLGFKAEIFHNFFLGWSIHDRIMINNVAGSAFPPLVVPGYGTGNKRNQFDMQYTISYLIPLNKIAVPAFPKKKKPKPEPKQQ